MKEVDEVEKSYKESTTKKTEEKSILIIKNRLIIPQGYHGILNNLAKYILYLEKLAG